MKTLALPFALALLTHRASAHYVFNRLIINGTTSKDFQYIRDVAGNAGTYDELWLKAFPIFGPENVNITCGRGSFPVRNAATIDTATIIAGTEVGFKIMGPFYEGDDIPQTIYHDGPGQIFLSKLPDGIESLNDYDPAGHDFFKIGYSGPISATKWALMDHQSMNVTIPKTTPPGKYIMRIEQWLPAAEKGQSQWFVNCAHVDILGEGGGTPGPMIRFPGAYDEEDESVWFYRKDWPGYPRQDQMEYKMPAPAVWTG